MNQLFKVYDYMKELDDSFSDFGVDLQIKINLKAIKEDTKIYRYTSFTNLLSMLEGRLYLSPRLAFSDRREQGEYTSEYIKVYYKTTLDRNRQKFRENVQKKFLQSTYFNVSCWTMEDKESFPMWKAYKGDEISVRIKTDIHSLLTSIKDSNVRLYCGPMNYGEEEDRIEMRDILFRKTEEYADEKEYRIYAIKEEYDLSANHTSMLLSIDPKELIHEIYFSPFVHRSKILDLCNLLAHKYPFIESKLNYSDLIEY